VHTHDGTVGVFPSGSSGWPSGRRPNDRLKFALRTPLSSSVQYLDRVGSRIPPRKRENAKPNECKETVQNSRVRPAEGHFTESLFGFFLKCSLARAATSRREPGRAPESRRPLRTRTAESGSRELRDRPLARWEDPRWRRPETAARSRFQRAPNRLP